MAEAKVMMVNRWGAGLGIRLPKEFTEKTGITDKSKVKTQIVEDTLVISVAKEPRKRKPLAEILALALENGEWDGKPAEITAEGREWLNMPPVGAEVIPYD